MFFDVDPDRCAVRVGEASLTYGRLVHAARSLASGIHGDRMAVWATPSLDTVVGVVAGLLAGVPVVPVNPKIGSAELAHIVSDARPSSVLCGPDDVLPAPLDALPRVVSAGQRPVVDVDAERPALIMYTSGTTGPPKGVVLPRRALTHCLDGLAQAWDWTSDDVVVHALPLFHVHGLVLGVLGPLRRGGTVHHFGRFSPDGLATAIRAWRRPVVVFGVPTMYHRLADALHPDTGATGTSGNAGLADAVAGARLLVSGSAALPLRDHTRIRTATGRRVVERYGMTETLITTAVHADGAQPAGTVGIPLPGTEIRLVDDDGGLTGAGRIGEIQVRGDTLFTGYLNRPDATSDAYTHDGWFQTGDMAVAEQDGSIRIVGRKATDIIKTGGFKIGAGEIENALAEHPDVQEVAVTGEPDDDLGERIVAWVVSDRQPPPQTLIDHVAELLTPHKRPREIRYVDALPRNELGKVTKSALKR